MALIEKLDRDDKTKHGSTRVIPVPAGAPRKKRLNFRINKVDHACTTLSRSVLCFKFLNNRITMREIILYGEILFLVILKLFLFLFRVKYRTDSYLKAECNCINIVEKNNWFEIF